MRKLAVLAILFIIGLLSPFSTSVARAFPVPELPEDNLITNPWFRSASDPTKPGLDGWIDAAGENKYWSTSQKDTNPSPDIVVSGICGNRNVFCGTTARLHPRKVSGGEAVPGVDAYLSQVVTANSSHRKLKFFMHWVTHRVDPAEVRIYGSDSVDGPWTLAWTPFYFVLKENYPVARGGDQSLLWTKTNFLETIIAEGYSHYKVEIHGRLPEGENIGVKISGIYFATEYTDEPAKPPAAPTPMPTMTFAPEVFASGSQGKSRESRNTPTATPGLLINPVQIATLLPSASPVPTPSLTSTPSQFPTPSIAPLPTAKTAGDAGSGLLISGKLQTVASFALASLIILSSIIIAVRFRARQGKSTN